MHCRIFFSKSSKASHRDDADKKIHAKPDILVKNLIMVGVIDKYQRKVPERPEYAENKRCFKVLEDNSVLKKMTTSLYIDILQTIIGLVV